jgi:hypothetical protein
MQHTIDELERIINDYAARLSQLSEDEFALKSLPGKWSKKETLGHLIDSVQNNTRRFIVAQYEDNPHIVYEPDFWVTAAGYQHYYSSDLVTLWLLLNKHACRILQNIPEEAARRECFTGGLHSIEWLAQDYNKHLLHHLHQILNLEAVAYP